MNVGSARDVASIAAKAATSVEIDAAVGSIAAKCCSRRRRQQNHWRTGCSCTGRVVTGALGEIIDAAPRAANSVIATTSGGTLNTSITTNPGYSLSFNTRF